MPEYLAKYGGTAFEVSFGGNMPYDVHETYKFPAENEQEAKTLAENQKMKISRNLIGARITLESLFEIKEVLV